MPAMSPTMTEGGISSWKVKDGDAFSAGDVLLEIETDKATMDIEAQDDGVVAKIIQADGAKGVQVGSRIAVLAEPGDDVKSIEIPPEEPKGVAEQDQKSKDSQSESSRPLKAEPRHPPSSSKPPSSSSKPSSSTGQNRRYPLYPAVTALIQENNISESEIPKIPATGPNSRLLKGDVLSYLGRIESDYSSSQSKRIQQLAHLDLKNIKTAPPHVGKEAEPEAAPRSRAPPSEHPAQTSVSLPVSLAEVLKVQKRIQETLSISVPLSTFLARAVDYANDDLPKPKDAKPSQDELFNAILGLGSIPKTSRGGYIPQLSALPSLVSSTATTNTTNTRSSPSASVTRRSKKPLDIMDILTGKASPASRPSSSVSAPPTAAAAAKAARGITAKPTTTTKTSTSTHGATNYFSVTVPVGEERRARTFLERVKTILQVEPGSLVI